MTTSGTDAHDRHCHTEYDALLSSGWDCEDVRQDGKGNGQVQV